MIGTGTSRPAIDEQHGDHQLLAHDVAEQPHGQGQRARELGDDLQRQQQRRRLQVMPQVAAQAPGPDAVERHGQEDDDGQRGGRREVGRRRAQSPGTSPSRLAVPMNRASVTTSGV